MENTELILLVPGLSAALGLVVQVLKRHHLSSRYAALAAVVLGVVVSVLYALETGESAIVGSIGGFLAGATAAGVYSGTKALTAEGSKEILEKS